MYQQAENKWLFTSSQLKTERQNLAAKYPAVTLDEQMHFIHFFASKIPDYCSVLQLSLQIKLTALALFHRIYTQKTIFEIETKHAVIISLFLAAKIETPTSNTDLAVFLSKIPKSPTITEFIILESQIANVLCYDFQITHPLIPLYGFFIDLKPTLEDAQSFYTLHYLPCVGLVTECYVQARNMEYTASQLAFCLLYSSAPEIMEGYIRSKLAIQDGVVSIGQIEYLLELAVSFEKVKYIKTPDKSVLSGIAAKIKNVVVIKIEEPPRMTDFPHENQPKEFNDPFN